MYVRRSLALFCFCESTLTTVAVASHMLGMVKTVTLLPTWLSAEVAHRFVQTK